MQGSDSLPRLRGFILSPFIRRRVRSSLVERFPDKKEAHGPIPCAPTTETLNVLPPICMGYSPENLHDRYLDAVRSQANRRDPLDPSAHFVAQDTLTESSRDAALASVLETMVFHMSVDGASEEDIAAAVKTLGDERQVNLFLEMNRILTATLLAAQQFLTDRPDLIGKTVSPDDIEQDMVFWKNLAQLVNVEIPENC